MNKENYYIFLNVIGIFRSANSMISSNITINEDKPLIDEYFSKPCVDVFNNFIKFIKDKNLRPRIVLLGIDIKHEELAYSVFNRNNIDYEDEIIFTKRTVDFDDNPEIVYNFLLTNKIQIGRYIVFDSFANYTSNIAVVSTPFTSGLTADLIEVVMEYLNYSVNNKYVS